MAHDYLEILIRLAAALAAGGFIGLERSHRGRPAGFRTHALVCVASCLLMLVTVYEKYWILRTGSATSLVLDPTRMAQGIMTGIGFLGAGAIIKEGFTVRGLTTAASIWVTAALGILVGVGFYFPAAVGVLLALGTLSAFRWVEARLPTESYANFMVRFRRDSAMTEADLREVIQAHGLWSHGMSYRLHGEAGVMEYRSVVRTMHTANLQKLSRWLAGDARVLEFRIAPTSE